MVATFWMTLTTLFAELCQQLAAKWKWRSVLLDDCRDRTLPHGEEPEVLDAWSRLLDNQSAGHFG